MDMFKIFNYFVLEAERLLGALLPGPKGFNAQPQRGSIPTILYH